MKNALITPCYAPDYERCRLLVESANRWVTGLDAHYLLIDRRDEYLFSPLIGGRVRLLLKETLLPPWMHPPLVGRKWWVSLKTLPVRGWILQQVVKLAVAEVIDADAFVFADADVFFVRSWDAQSLWQHGNLRLFRASRGGELLTSWRYRNWYRAAALFAGISNPKLINGAYIAQLVSWRRDNALALLRAIEQATQKPWKLAMLAKQDFSEFICYGTYVEHRLQVRGHFLDDQELTLSSWHFEIKSSEDIQAFLKAIEPRHVAVHIQSNLHLSAQGYTAILQKLTEDLHARESTLRMEEADRLKE